MLSIWKKINKLLGVINLILGFVVFYKIIEFTKKQFYLFQSISKQQGFLKNQHTLFDLLINNWFFLLIAILFIVSGFLILIKNRFGWFFGYCCWIVLIFIFIPITIYGIRDVTVTITGQEYWIQIYAGIGLFLSLVILMLFSLNPIRALNKVSKKFWIQSIVFIVLFYLITSIINKYF